MDIFPLSNEERIGSGFSHVAIIRYTDIATAAATVALTLASLTAGQFITRTAHRLVADFASANGTALGMSLGNAGTATQYAPSRELQATEIDYGAPTPALAAGAVTELYHPVTAIADWSTSAIDLLTTFTPGFAGDIIGLEWVTTKAGTGSSASQTVTMKIGSTAVTGGSINLTLANQGTVGAVLAASAITGANRFGASDTITLRLSVSGTVFTAGAGYFVVKVRRADADGLADQVGDTEALKATFLTTGGSTPLLSDYTAGEVRVYFTVVDLTKI